MVDRRSMTDSAEPDSAEIGPVHYAEPGASWWPVLWGPGFAVLGFTMEVLTRGPVHGPQWLLLAGALAIAAAAWVAGRRRLYSVRLTAAALVVGREAVPVGRIAAVPEEEAPVGARVLGGGWTVPKGTIQVPLRLRGEQPDGKQPDGERVVLAWARRPEELARALRSLDR